MYTCG